MTEHRAVTIVSWTVIVAMAGLALAMCVQAWMFPLELELREGTAWLHVLALRAGVPLYDHGQVAFVNMNHGPLDPVLKHGIAIMLPWLTPAMVTRFFVVLLPLGLWLAFRRALPGAPRTSLAWAGGLQLFLLGLQPPHFLLGRSDPTALFLFALMLWQASAKPEGRPLLRHAAMAALGALSLAANWRNFPAVGAVLVGFGIEALAAAPAGRRFITAGKIAGAQMLGFATPVALILLGQFRGDLDLYWRHFFGFFSAASGWGSTAAEAFALVPLALLRSHTLAHAALLALAVFALMSPSARVPQKIQLAAWLPLLALLWVTCSVAYHLNHGGGGLHYYAAFYALLAFHLARTIAWERLPWPALGALLIAGLPSASTWTQCVTLARSAEPAHAFLAACREAAGPAPIYSEDYQLFKMRYGGERVDMGDEVYAVSRTGYFGAAFTATATRAFAELEKNPPPFVIVGECASPPLNALLARAYAPALRVPYQPGPFAGPAQTLFRLKPTASPP